VTLTEQSTAVILLVIISSLGIVQIPLDIKSHHLSRSATLFGLCGVVAVGATSSLLRGSPHRLVLSSALTVGVWGVYYLVHRLSPSRLGFGDVLLVLPLSFAIATVTPELLVIWQLLSAVSGAIHGISLRLSKRGSHLPFGPHLLFGAWLVLVTSV
jgi:prepilin signal peptidase PulO-like enzyme (type II secretory pathway)